MSASASSAGPIANTIYLHIGTEKTGTTSVQDMGRLNREALKRSGVLYPAAPGDQNHQRLTVFAATPSDLSHSLAVVEGLGAPAALAEFMANFIADLAREITASGCKTVLMSGEHLSSRLKTAGEVKRLIDALKPLARTIKVIMYVRPQHELALSAYSTAIKSGNEADLEERIPRNDKYHFFNYMLPLTLWSNELGDDNIIVRVYHRKALEAGDVVVDILKVIGIDAAACGIDLPQEQNTRLDGDGVFFLRLFNRYVPYLSDTGINPDRADVLDALDAVCTGRSLKLADHDVRIIRYAYEKSNAEVATRFLKRADGVLFPSLPPLPAGPRPKVLDHTPLPAEARISPQRAAAIALDLWRWKRRQIDTARNDGA